MRYRVQLSSGEFEEFIDPDEASVLDGGVLRIVHNDYKEVRLFAPGFWAGARVDTPEEQS